MTQYHYSAVEKGWVSSRDDTSNVDRIRLAGNESYFAAKITGTDAYMAITWTASPTNIQIIQVSVDGSSFSTAAYRNDPADDEFVIFTGLADTEHVVLCRVMSYMGTNGFVDKTAPWHVEVLGASPNISVLPNVYHPDDSDTAQTDFTSVCGFMRNNGNATYLPARLPYTNDEMYSNSVKVAISTNATEFCVVLREDAQDVFVSVDRAKGVKKPTSGSFSNGAICYFTGDGSTHEYIIYAESSILAVMANAAMTPAPTNGKWIVVGDSISAGDAVDSNGGSGEHAATDHMEVAIHFGYMPETIAISGWTSTSGMTALTGNIASNNLVSLDNTRDIGQNNMGRNDTWTGRANETDYKALTTWLSDRCLTVFVRDQITEGGSTFDTQYTLIQDYLTELALPNTQFLDMTALGDVDDVDGLHPSAAGYDQIATFEIAELAPYFTTVVQNTAVKAIISISISIGI